MSTQTLSQRLRELREVLMSEESDTANVMNLVDECIAQAEAQEAQAGELSDEFVKARAMEIYPPDEVNDGHPWYGHRRAIEDTAARQMVRHLHTCGYLQPSQAIGEQTPVAKWPEIHYTTIPDDGPAPLVLAYLRACAKSWEPGVRILGNLRASDIIRVLDELEARSPISTEARDKAIEALEGSKKMLLLTKIVHRSVECGKSADLCDQALSALRK